MPIMNIDKFQSVDVLRLVISQICEYPELMEDIVYKDLLKLGINKLALLSKSNYNEILLIFSKFGEKVSKLIDNDHSKILIVLDICTYITQKLIDINGRNKGKFLKLVLVHVKILTTLINSNLY